MSMNFDASKNLSSGFLNAAHIQDAGDQVIVTIIDGDEKRFDYPDGKSEDAIVLKLAECQQDLKLNQTRRKAMIKLFGPNGSDWQDQKIMLTTMPTQVGDTIVIKPAPKTEAQVAKDAHDSDDAAVVFN